MAVGTQTDPRDLYGDETGAGVREDVLDRIFQITPTDTPFFNKIGTSSASNVWHSWTTRALATRDLANHLQEGAPFAGGYDAANLPARVTNICQILRKLPQVSETIRATEVVGVTDLMSDQVDIHLKEWKTDCEKNLLRQTLSTGTSLDATSRLMGGFYNRITTNAYDYSSTGSIEEVKVTDLAQTIWAAGGDPKAVLVNAKAKRDIGTFAASNTKYLYGPDKTVVAVVNIYETDFGVTEVSLSRDILAGEGLESLIMFDPSFFAKSWLRRPSVEMLPKTGDSVEAVIIGEGTLEYGHESAAGKITDVLN